MDNKERRALINRVKAKSKNWRREEIARVKARGGKGVNFTHYQTIEEAEAELDEREREDTP